MPIIDFSYGSECAPVAIYPVSTISTGSYAYSGSFNTDDTDNSFTDSFSGAASWGQSESASYKHLDNFIFGARYSAYAPTSYTTTACLSDYSLNGSSSWDIYTTTQGQTSNTVISHSSTSDASQTFTAISGSIKSHSFDASQTRQSNYTIFGTFTECQGTSSVTTQTSIEVSFSAASYTTETYSFYSLDDVASYADPGNILQGSILTATETTFEVSSLSFPVAFGGYVPGVVDFLGTTYGDSLHPGNTVFLIHGSHGEVISCITPIVSSIHPFIEEAVSFTDWTTGRWGDLNTYSFKYISADQIAYTTTTEASSSTVQTTHTITLSISSTIDSTASVSFFAGFYDATTDATITNATLPGGQIWTATWEWGIPCIYGITSNFSDSTTSDTIFVDDSFSSTFSIEDGANIVFGPFRYNPPYTYLSDGSLETYSGSYFLV